MPPGPYFPGRHGTHPGFPSRPDNFPEIINYLNINKLHSQVVAARWARPMAFPWQPTGGFQKVQETCYRIGPKPARVQMR